jgi:large repetitive protein
MTGRLDKRTTRSARLIKLAALLIVLALAGVGALAAFGASTVPTPTITAKPTNPTSSTSAVFSFTGAPSGGSYQCKLDAAPFTACASPKTYTVAAGSHTFQVRAVDKSKTSDPASWTWTVDLTAPPAPSITAKPSNPSDQTAPSFSFSDGEGGVSFQCKLDALAYAACTSPKSYSALALGSHTFSVQAMDAVGNLSLATSYTWSIVPPAPTITAKPANPTNITSASFSFTDALAGVTYVCALDTPTFTACASPQNYAGSLAQGSHTFQVKAVSGVHQSASTVYTWTVDTAAPPTPSITAKPASLSNTTSPSFSFSDTEAGVGFLCNLDEGGYVACTSPTSYVGLAQGGHTFSVQATDAAGNIGGATSWSWTIDSVPPPAPVITDKPDDPNGDGLADFTWITDAGVAYYRCMIENEGFLPCDSPYRHILNIANSGQHQFAVRAYDVAGNFSETSYTWKVDIGLRFTIVGNAIGLLYPGGPTRMIDLVLHNPNNSPILVDQLSVTLESKSACPTTNFVLIQPGSDQLMTPMVSVPANGSVHVPTAQQPTLQLLNTASNQDACKNLTFALTYTGHAIK